MGLRASGWTILTKPTEAGAVARGYQDDWRTARWAEPGYACDGKQSDDSLALARHYVKASSWRLGSSAIVTMG
jgi:hypothetical protein